MTAPKLDLWNEADAQAVAQHLSRPDAELLVVLGAAAWCTKCQRLHPAFEQLSQGLPPTVLPLWLDLEEHAEFIGDFIPPDLPLLLRWRRGHCIQAAVLQDIQPGASNPGERVRMQALEIDGDCLRDPHDEAMLKLPPLWKTLAS